MLNEVGKTVGTRVVITAAGIDNNAEIVNRRSGRMTHHTFQSAAERVETDILIGNHAANLAINYRAVKISVKQTAFHSPGSGVNSDSGARTVAAPRPAILTSIHSGIFTPQISKTETLHVGKSPLYKG